MSCSNGGCNILTTPPGGTASLGPGNYLMAQYPFTPPWSDYTYTSAYVRAVANRQQLCEGRCRYGGVYGGR